MPIRNYKCHYKLSHGKKVRKKTPFEFDKTLQKRGCLTLLR